MKCFLAVLLLSLLLTSQAAVFNQSICRFDRPQALNHWKLRTQGTAASAIVRTPDETGRSAVEVIFPKCDQWPALHSDKQLLSDINWQDYDSLVLEVFNPLDRIQSVKLEVRFRSAADNPYQWKQTLVLKPGGNTIRIPYGEDVKSGRFEEIFFFVSQPPAEVKFFLEELRLETREVAELQLELRQISDRLIPPPSTPLDLKTEIENFRKTAQTPADTPELLRQLETARKLDDAISPYRMAADRDRFQHTAVNGIAYGWANGIDRIYRDRMVFPGTVGGNGLLEVAGDETEGVQLVLRSTETIHNLSVAVGAFRDERGNPLPEGSVTVFPVGYVDIKPTQYYADRTGWTPDPVLSYLKKVELEKEMYQPFLIEAAIPANQAAGNYTGTVMIRAGEKELREIPLTIRVFDFTLPRQGRLQLSITSRFDDGTFDALYGNNDSAAVNQFRQYLAGKLNFNELAPGARSMVEMMLKFEKEIEAHRIPIDNMFRREPIPEADMRRNLAGRNTLVNAFMIDKHNTQEEILAFADRLYPILQKNNWLDQVYLYSYDDLDAHQLDLFQKNVTELKKRYPEFKILTNAFDDSLGSETGLNSIVDIWVPLTTKYLASPEIVAAARKAGKQVWWYVCCYPSPPSANWLLESRPTGTRLLMGFMPYKFGVDGFLQWGIVRWRGNRSIQENGKTVVRELNWPEHLKGGPLTNSDGCAFIHYNGDGMVFYPGESGPVSSMRAKQIRDGLEDYEYLKTLESICAEVRAGTLQATDGWLAEAEAALRIGDELCESDLRYTLDGSDILQQRRRLALLIEKSNTFPRKQRSSK